MTFPEPRPGPVGSEPQATVRARWRTASLAAGWRYAGDWPVPEVDQVCAAVASRGDLATSLWGLGAARAAAGVGLAETLTDVAALHAVLAHPEAADGLVSPDLDALPSRVVRVTALGWSDTAIAPLRWSEAVDPLTGLATPAYLRTRLGELYRSSGPGRSPQEVLAMLMPRPLDAGSWSRLAASVLLSDVVRAVFRTGETVAVIGPSVAAVLARPDRDFGRRLRAARDLADERLAADPCLAAAVPVRGWLERLPADYAGACALIVDLTRG